MYFLSFCRDWHGAGSWSPSPLKIMIYFYRIISSMDGGDLSGESRSQTLQWRHNEHDSVSNHQPHHYLLNRLFGRRSKKTSKLHVTGLCAGNSPGTGEFPAQMASNAENVSIWWRHHESIRQPCYWPSPPAKFWFRHQTLLTHWGRDKMAAISQTILSNAFSWMKILEFRLKFHWSLFLRVQLTVMAWRRPGDKPLSEPMMVRSLTHICVTRPQWVNSSLPSPRWWQW